MGWVANRQAARKLASILKNRRKKKKTKIVFIECRIMFIRWYEKGLNPDIK